MKLLPLGLIIAAGINSCVGNVFLKWSRSAVPEGTTIIMKLLSPWFIGGLIFYAINVVLFAKALDDIEVSIAYPILAGIGFALLAIFSAIYLNEPMTASKIVGIVLVLLGIAVLAKTS